MATVFIKFQDTSDAEGIDDANVNIQLKFDPPLSRQHGTQTPAQQMAWEIFEYIKEKMGEEVAPPKVTRSRRRS